MIPQRRPMLVALVLAAAMTTFSLILYAIDQAPLFAIVAAAFGVITAYGVVRYLTVADARLIELDERWRKWQEENPVATVLIALVPIVECGIILIKHMTR